MYIHQTDVSYIGSHRKVTYEMNRSHLPVTNIKTDALVAYPAFSSYHKSRAVTARMLQMDHDEIFVHWVNGFSELHIIDLVAKNNM